MKVWYCGYSGVAWIEGKSPGDGVGCRPYWITERGNDYQHDHVTKYGCGEMQLVPADARTVTDQAIIIEKDDPLYADIGQLIWMRR